jgi:branched-chain amino acid transport system substrate-binding protein
VQDVLVGQAFGEEELGLGHYEILATVPGDAESGIVDQSISDSS